MNDLFGLDGDPVRGAIFDLDGVLVDTAKYHYLAWAFNFWPAGIIEVHLAPVAQRFFTSRMSAEELLAALDTAWVTANN